MELILYVSCACENCDDWGYYKFRRLVLVDFDRVPQISSLAIYGAPERSLIFSQKPAKIGHN